MNSKDVRKYIKYVSAASALGTGLAKAHKFFNKIRTTRTPRKSPGKNSQPVTASKAPQGIIGKRPTKFNTGAKNRRFNPKKSKKGREVATKKYVKSVVTRANRRELDGHLIYRGADTFQLTAAVNVTNSNSVEHGVALLELALAQLRYFDPSAPGTLITGSGVAQTYSSRFLIKYSTSIDVRNAARTDVDVKLYSLGVKGSHAIAADTAYSNGLADEGNPTNTSILLYPEDSRQLWQLWKKLKYERKILKPGASMSMEFTSPWFEYDPSVQDSVALAYQASAHSSAYLYEIMGTVSHDITTTGNVGTSAAAIDYIFRTEVQVKYEAGADVKFIFLNENLDAQAAGGGQAVPARGLYVYGLGAQTA